MHSLRVLSLLFFCVFINNHITYCQKYKISKTAAKNLKKLLHAIDGGEDRDSIIALPVFSEIETPNDSIDSYRLNFEKEDWKNIKQLLISIDSKTVMAELNRWSKYYSDYSKKYSKYKKDYYFWKKFHKEIYKIQIEYQFKDFHEEERILYYVDIEAQKQKIKEKLRKIRKRKDSLYKDSIAKIKPIILADSLNTTVRDTISD